MHCFGSIFFSRAKTDQKQHRIMVQFLWLFKRSTRTLKLRLNENPPDFLLRKKQTNIHESVTISHIEKVKLCFSRRMRLNTFTLVSPNLLNFGV